MIIQAALSEDTITNSGATFVARPNISTDGSERVVMAWEGLPPLDTDLRVYGAMYSRDATTGSLSRIDPPGDVLVSSVVVGAQDQPDVSMNAQKRFCVVWATTENSFSQVKFRPYENDFISPLAGEQFVDINPTVQQYSPQVAFSDTSIDIFAIVWVDEQPSGQNTLRATVWSLYDDSGPVPIPGLSFLNAFDIVSATVEGTPSTIDPRLTVNKQTGDFVVVWTSIDDELGVDVIRGQAFNRNGLIGASFVVSDGIVSASSPRIEMRPDTNEFAVSWLQSSDLFWKRMYFSDLDGGVNLIQPDPGIQQVTGAQAFAQADLIHHTDGALLFGWIDSVSTDLMVVRYDWADVPSPPNSANASLVQSTPTPHGGVAANLVSSQNIVDGEMCSILGSTLVASVDDTLSDITVRSLTDTEQYGVADIIESFNSPAIFGASSVDSVPVGLLENLYFEEKGLSGIAFNPEIRNITDLDNFLGGQDLLCVGGPIFNSMSSDLLSENTLKSNVDETEAIEILFSTTGDGVLLGASAPQMFVKNQNIPAGYYTFERTQNGPHIEDYAVIFQLIGTTNRLIMIAGIRDFGTAVAAYILDEVRKGEGVSGVPAKILRLWTSILNTQKAVVVKFSIDNADNTASASTVLLNLDVNLIELVPVQAIASDNP